MGWIDIVFIAIIVICAIIGLAKGLFESILSIFSSVLSIVVAILVSKPVAAFINKIVDANTFFANLLIKWKWITPNENNQVEIFNKLYSVEEIGNICTIIISVIAVWLLIKLAILLLSKLFDSATASNSAVSGLNRVLGLIFGAAKGLLIGCIGLAFAAILAICGVGNVKTTMEQNKMSNFFYNYISEWVGTTLEDRIEDFLGKGETPEESGETTGDETAGDTTTETEPENPGTETATESQAVESSIYVTFPDGTKVAV